ncbi:hypothetical protein [Magnetofaba australis]|uniref:hypothetical protein n=1 Tax=Magnetofaba australis TaxID=1472297 RepID=UPI000A19E5A6|nr:hypothetical protein [Magnetofaba australis]
MSHSSHTFTTLEILEKLIAAERSDGTAQGAPRVCVEEPCWLGVVKIVLLLLVAALVSAFLAGLQ